MPRRKGKGRGGAKPAQSGGGASDTPCAHGSHAEDPTLPRFEPDFAVHELPFEIDERYDDGTNNSADELLASLSQQRGRGGGRKRSGSSLSSAPSTSKIVWHVRHGQSEGNVAREEGLDYQSDVRYIDTPLSARGEAEARGAAALVADSWRGERPSLVVCSAMTRAIQTAALMFRSLLVSGEARLVVRPEVREFWPDNIENCGRTLAELLACPALARCCRGEDGEGEEGKGLDGGGGGGGTLAAVVRQALSKEATADWRAAWDGGQAGGGGGRWQAHCVSGARMERFRHWLSARAETRIAVVSHWGAINNLLNREPWAAAPRGSGAKRFHVSADWFPESWHAKGLAQMFAMHNCGWVCVEYREAEAGEGS